MKRWNREMPACLLDCLSVRGLRLCREMKLLHFIINIDLVDIHSKSNVCLRKKLLSYNVSLTIVHFIQESGSCVVVDHPVTFLVVEIHPGRQLFDLFLTYKNSSINQLNYANVEFVITQSLPVQVYVYHFGMVTCSIFRP